MAIENQLLNLLSNELEKLSPQDVSNFCGELFFKSTEQRLQANEGPRFLEVELTPQRQQVQILKFIAQDHSLIEVALLRSKWDLFSQVDRLVYHFFGREFTCALFAKPETASTPGRQHLSDVFVILWLLTQPKAVQKKWNLHNGLIKDLEPFFQQISDNQGHHAEGDDNHIDSLLVCVPNPAVSESLSSPLIAAPSTQSPTLFQGALFKAHNPSHLVAKAQSLDAQSIGAQLEKWGLCEVQIRYKSGRIQTLRNNEDLLSHLENHRSERADRRMLDKLCKITDDDSLLLRTFERNKFSLIDKYFNEHKPVYLVYGYDPTKERTSFLCHNFSFCSFGGIYEKPEIQISSQGGLGQLHVKLKRPEPLKKAFVTNQIAFQKDSSTLIFHDFHQMARKFMVFMGESTAPQVLEKWMQGDTPFIIQGHQAAFQFLKNLFDQFSKEVQIQTLEQIKIEAPLLTSLSVDRESFQILHRAEGQNLPVTVGNFSPRWRDILRGCEMGFVGTLLSKSIDSLYSVRRTQRAHESKFLKHPGIFMFVLHSVLEWRFQHEGLGQTKALFYEKLWERIVLLFSARVEGQKSETIDDILSVKVQKVAIEFIENVLDLVDLDFETPLLGENKIIYFRSLPYEEAKLIYYWLNSVATVTQGDLFTKSTSKYFPSDWFAHRSDTAASQIMDHYLIENSIQNQNLSGFRRYSSRNQESLYQLPLSNWARISQTFESYDVRIDGKPLEQIDGDHFRVSFEVTQGAPDHIGHDRIDWFDLNPKYFLHGQEISELDARKLTFDGVLEYQGRFYILDQQKFPNHKALEIFWNRLQFNANKGGRQTKKNDEDTLSQRHHVLELLALRRMGIPFSGPKEWEDICTYYDRLSQPRGSLDLGDKLQSILKPYQLSGVQWLWDLFQLRIGGILADDMGLGKTAQALSFLNYGFQNKAIKKVLIVVPVSLTFNWISESDKFTPGLQVGIFDPKIPASMNNDVIVCTYSLLSIHHQLFEKEVYDVVIFDEAQYLKNIGTNRFKSSEFLKAKFKIALTGTPIENNLIELYALFHLVAPGLLGSKLEFQRQFVRSTEVLDQNIHFLRAKLKPLILRRRKQDLALELPDKTENQIYVEFSKKQKELYRNTALSWSQKVNDAINQKGASQSKLYMLTALLRLRQICSDPAALPAVVYKEIPPKIQILIDMLEEITEEGHSAIVFTQFMSTFSRLKELLKKHNIKAFEMHGGTPRKDRETLLKDFSQNKDEKGSVLLMTLKTGGVGLNLTKASYVFHLEPWWNPAVENQATDRVHRLGQSKNVTVYRLIMKESVEEKVEVLKSRKAQLFNNLFGDDYFSLESVEESRSDDSAGQTTITKEDFDVLIQ